MQPTSPLGCYQQALSEGKYQPDAAQYAIVVRLDKIHHALLRRAASSVTTDWANRVLRLLGRKREAQLEPVRGLYLWGGVGRGKTWLMDIFYRSLPAERKLRLHFHRFMLRVHQEMSRLQGNSDPLEKVADQFKKETDVLCFDEFFVSDITDAMLLGTLLKALFDRGISLIATSNIPPDELYRNGLQRSRFLPAIAAIKHHCKVVNLDAGIDYRQRRLTQARLWMYPLNEQTLLEMDRKFFALTHSPREREKPVLIVNHRALPTSGLAGGVLAMDFNTLCGEARSQNDYIELSRRFHTVLLFNVSVMRPRDEDLARRFLALVDEFYERHVKLIVAAETSLGDIYQGERLKFDYQRCLSRLQEMQSEAYSRLDHLS